MDWLLTELGTTGVALGALALATATAGSVGAARWLKARRAARDRRRK